MTTSVTVEEIVRSVACDIADQLEHSWSTSDGAAWAEPFVDDADVITGDGTRISGRRAIDAGMSEILGAALGSDDLGVRVISIRCASPTVFIALIEHARRAPAGSPGSIDTALATTVVIRSSRGWEVTTMHLAPFHPRR